MLAVPAVAVPVGALPPVDPPPWPPSAWDCGHADSLVADDDPLGEALVAVLPLLDEQALVSDKGLRRGRRFLLGVRGAFSSSVSYGAGRTRSSGRGPAPLTVPRERDRVGGKQCQRAAQAEEQ
jgi:hypothetical protein